MPTSSSPSAWPTTFSEGVEASLVSPASTPVSRNDSRRSSYAERSPMLAQEISGFGALEGGKDLEVPHGLSSYRDAVLNTVNMLVGIGVLAIPFALRSSGWFIGLPLFLFMLVATNYTGKLLGRLLEYQEGMMTYPDIGEVAFGTRGRFVISVVFFSELFLACIAFNTLIADTLAILIPGYASSQLMIAAFLVLMPTLWTAHLSMLSWVSMLGVTSSIICFGVIMYVGAAIDINAPGYTTGSLWHPQPTELIADSDRIPIAIGLTMVAFADHSVFPSICSSMADRSEFPRVLDTSYIITGLVYGLIEVCAYLMFGTTTTKEITLNIVEVYPGALTTLVTWMIAVIPMSKMALTIHPIALSLEELVLTPEQMHHETGRIKLARACIRTTVGVASLLCAIFIPHFARLTSFVGASCAMFVAVTFPCAAYLKVYGHQLSLRVNLLNWFLLLSSVILGIIGSIAAFTSPAE